MIVSGLPSSSSYALIGGLTGAGISVISDQIVFPFFPIMGKQPFFLDSCFFILLMYKRISPKFTTCLTASLPGIFYDDEPVCALMVFPDGLSRYGE